MRKEWQLHAPKYIPPSLILNIELFVIYVGIWDLLLGQMKPLYPW